MIATFSQADVDLMKSWHMVLTPKVEMPDEAPAPVHPAQPVPDRAGHGTAKLVQTLEELSQKASPQLQEILILNAKILKAIKEYPTTLPLEMLYPLAEKPMLIPAVKALNQGGLIHWSQKKEGFFINPRAKDVVEAIIEQAGI